MAQTKRMQCSLIAILALSFPAAATAHPGSGIVVDGEGHVYLADLSRGLVKIDATGNASTVHQEGGHWLALDAEGRFAAVEFEKSPHWPRWFKRRTPSDNRPALITDGGSPLVVAQDGNLYYACNDERMIPGGLQIARLAPDGSVQLLNPALRETSERLGGIKGLAVGPDGLLYVSYPRTILKVTLKGHFSTVVDPVVVNDCDRHPSSIEDAPSLRGLAVDRHGTVFAAATGCRRVIRVAPDGSISTVLVAENPWSPCGVAIHGEDLYVLEHINPNSDVHEDWPPRVRKITPDGTITTLVSFAAAGENSK